MNDAPSRAAYYKGLGMSAQAKRGPVATPVKRQGGFTIIETMIVMAVTGFMLFAALTMISGQQNRVEFSQSVQDIQTVIQQTMNEVNAGFYPSSDNLVCTATGSGLILARGSRPQGTNSGCIFIGKVMQFGVNGTNGEDFIIHSVAAKQANDGTLADARPKAIAPGTGDNVNTYPDASDRDKLKYGLRAVSMVYVQGATRRPVSAVAFVSGLGSFDANNDLMSGTQQLSLIPVEQTGNLPGGQSSQQTVDDINGRLATSPLNPSGGVEICFASTGSNQSGLVRIGNGGRGLAVTLSVRTSGDCS